MVQRLTVEFAYANPIQRGASPPVLRTPPRDIFETKTGAAPRTISRG
ncbi:hypothetical protein SAMN05444287_1179 [Octadecabacter temperatus]|uniref:Uncharacterized protein n=1 Tax=Octadecabacter temperatus TaxID=1458307 RepID=A0A0K0Y534_9RHOB|nr:hypothetical protein OSB_15230 [Octadecabacter temperatus]SIO06945.1 hypothetical protein SAMN05444287_1179 [Octadecabacter temperatus]